MKIAVRYYTKTGNTKRLAEAIAEAVGAKALPISTPIAEPVDILFLGNSYYAFSIDPEGKSNSNQGIRAYPAGLKELTLSSWGGGNLSLLSCHGAQQSGPGGDWQDWSPRGWWSGYIGSPGWTGTWAVLLVKGRYQELSQSRQVGVSGETGGEGVVAEPAGCDMGLVFFHMVPGTWKYLQISPELAGCYEMPVFNYRCACEYGPMFPLVGYCGVWGRSHLHLCPCLCFSSLEVLGSPNGRAVNSRAPGPGTEHLLVPWGTPCPAWRLVS